MENAVEIDYSGLRRKLAKITTGVTRKRLNRHIGEVVLEQVKDHLDQMSVERHKIADRLGARHSRYFEFASGRMGGGRRDQKTELGAVTENSSTISIKNTPGLSRAYHDLDIKPKKAKALTIPLHRISYGKRVADLKRRGHNIFHPDGTRILAESIETGRGKKKKTELRPLYALVKSVHIPKDEGLLPTNRQIKEWAADAADDFFEAKMR